jgi:hypothetical protein
MESAAKRGVDTRDARNARLPANTCKYREEEEIAQGRLVRATAALRDSFVFSSFLVFVPV